MTRWRPYPEYRHSGLPWLPKVPVHWDIRKLKHVSSVTLSSVDKQKIEGEKLVHLCNYVDVYYNDYIMADLEFMEATASPEEVRRFALKEGDVIITKDSESWDDIAVAAYVPSDLEGVLCGYHLALVRPNQRIIDGKYLFQSFCTSQINEQFTVEATGITRYGLAKHWIDNASFLVPPPPEQHAIAAFLDHHTAKIDALIAEQRRLIELLQERRAALISHAVTKGLDHGAPMKGSGIPTINRIPAHWKVRRNKHIFDEINERSTTGDEELLTVSHITGVTPRSEKNVYMFLAESFEGYKICRPNDLIINTMWAWMGALGITEYEGIVSPSYHVYRLKKDQAPDYFPKYLDFLYRIPSYVCEITRHSKGIWSSRLRLYPDYFFEMYTPSPPFEEQRTIAAYLDRETAKIDALIAEIETGIAHLEEYRTALISAAVTGKIDVRDKVPADAPARPRLTSP